MNKIRNYYLRLLDIDKTDGILRKQKYSKFFIEDLQFYIVKINTKNNFFLISYKKNLRMTRQVNKDLLYC